MFFGFMEPYSDRENHLLMDNFDNRVSLSEQFLKRKTLWTGTLESDRHAKIKGHHEIKNEKEQYKWG